MTQLILMIAVVSSLITLPTAWSSPAQAKGVSDQLFCRDCPFPMKIGDNQWLMPDSNIVVQIIEQRLPDTSYTMAVSLVDSETGELLATGTAHRSKSQRVVNITLLDSHGRRIDGMIRWVNFTKSIIQVKFTCAENECVIGRGV